MRVIETLPAGVPERDLADSRAARRWLTRLRWGAIFAQLMAIAVATELTDVTLLVVPLYSLVAIAVASNVVLEMLVARGAGGRRLVMAVQVFDVALLTGLLVAAGGPTNPFAIFYLVHVALAGFLLGARGAFIVAGLAALCFGLLFALPSGPLETHSEHMRSLMSLHLYGMWIAFGLSSAFIAIFVAGLAKALAGREAELARMRSRAERSERLAALSTFSANAAHDIGSPLGTIAVVAHELERGLAKIPGGEAHLDDVHLIQREVERCRSLVHDLTRRGGLLEGERPEAVSALDLWLAVRERHAGRVAMAIADGSAEATLVVPRAAVVGALANLVQNAHLATVQAGNAAPVTVGTSLPATGRVRLWVRDAGRGFAPEVLAELGEAFVTTRRGDGFGLGLYLAGQLARELGGRLDVRSGPTGSEVALELPIDPINSSGPIAPRAQEGSP